MFGNSSSHMVETDQLVAKYPLRFTILLTVTLFLALNVFTAISDTMFPPRIGDDDYTYCWLENDTSAIMTDSSELHCQLF